MGSGGGGRGGFKEGERRGRNSERSRGTFQIL